MSDETSTPPLQLPSRAREHHLRAVFEAAADGIWITSADGTILDLNPAALARNQLSAEEVIGANVQSIVDQGVVDRSATLEVLKRRRPVSFVQQLGRTGQHLLVTGVPVYGESGEIENVVVFERDVTDLKNMRQVMEEDRRARRKAQEELSELNLMELADREIVAESKEMRQALSTCLKLARSEAPVVLILGESGTGKGLLAKFLHQSGPHAQGPFIQISCGSLPPALFEAELFGHEQGAYSGATEAKAGLLELARGGTFFLDEVADLPLEIQSKLLQCLDQRSYYPLGGRQARSVDCRILAASNRDLGDLAARKRFRQDLYYRLSGFELRIPPLRERPEDVFGLAQALLDKLNAEYRTRKRLSPRAVNLLQNHPFPGNVRELQGLLHKAVVISEDDLLDGFLAETLGGQARGAGQGGGLVDELDALERELLLRAAATCRTTRQMAQYLGLSQPTLVRKLRKHGLRSGATKSGKGPELSVERLTK
mgnify:CR=1 FL=1